MPQNKKGHNKTKISDLEQTRRTVLATEALGWYGAAAILIAYTLVSINVLDVHSTPYLILNFTGAIGILTVATAKHVKQSMLINSFWALMAAIALFKIILQV